MSLATALLLAAQGWAAATAPTALERAGVLYQQGKLSPAAAAYAAEGRAASSARAWLDAGVVYRDLGEEKKALEMFREAARLQPADSDIQAALGWAAWKAGEAATAEAAFRTSVDLDARNARALLGWGRMLFERGEVATGLERLERAANSDPDSSQCWLQLARALRAAGAEPRAAEAYEKALQTDPGAVELRLELALLYQKLGDADDAWRQYSLVLRAAPRHAAARRARKQLQKLLKRPPSKLLPEAAPKDAEAPHAAPFRESMPDIRVAIGTNDAGRPVLKLARAFRCTGRFAMSDPATGRRMGEGEAGQRYIVRPAKGGGYELASLKGAAARFSKTLAVEPLDPEKDAVMLERVDTGPDGQPALRLESELKGRVEFHVRGRGFYVVNQLPIEDYVYGVVTGEMPSRFPPEALKAQAVLARTHALFVTRHFPFHHKYKYDLCDGQHCQVYGGVTGESGQSRAAAEATRGLVLRYRGSLAQTPYSSNCGGRTQASGDIPNWTGLPYLPGVPDSAETDAPPVSPWELDLWLRRRPSVFCNVGNGMPPARFRWTRTIAAAELEARVHRISNIGPLKSLLVVRRSEAGYANELWFIGDNGRVRVDREQKIRGLIGLGSVQSTLFVVETERDRKGRPKEFVFHGGGWGHGVGLCQYGAAGRALHGQDFRGILQHYFPGTELDRLNY